MDSDAAVYKIEASELRRQTMFTPSEKPRDPMRSRPNGSNLWKLLVLASATLLAVGILLRLSGVEVPGWILVATGAAAAFILIVPALGGRMREPQDSPFKKVPWGF